MPKDRSHSCLSSDRSRASPYSRTSKNAEQCGSKSTLPSVGDKGEWNDTRCVICMEHPHNAVLLLCSSHEKGCRPYMCDTSDRHSNCFDQFRKTSPLIQTSDPGVDFSCSYRFNKLENKLTCPLCRGQISGWMVVEDARSFMNSKSRNCSLESCSFVGTYQELGKHARCEHPLLRPTEVDPRRQEQWTRMENERTLEDLLGVSEHGNDLIDLADLFLSDDDSNLSFFSQLEPEGDLDDVLGVGSFPFFSQFEPEVERGIMDMNFELELPFSFMEMPFPWGDPYHSSVHDSPLWSYRLRNRELNRSMSQPVNSTGGFPSWISSPNRGRPRQHSAGQDAYGSQYGWFPLMDAFGGQDGYGVFSSEKHASTPAAYRRVGSTTQMFPAANGRRAGSIVSGGAGGYYGNHPMTPFRVSPFGSLLLPGSPVAAGANTPGRRNELRFSQGVSNRNVGAYTGWHGERGVDSSDDPQKKHSILDELKSCSARKIDLSDIAGRIVEFSIDQHGSRFIQQKLESCGVEERESVFREILPHAPKLMTDVLGNYVIQKFFEHGSREQWKQLADQLSGQILPLTLQMYGCRVIHKVLEVIELDQKTELVHELDGHVLRCAQDQNGNHVIQKCIVDEILGSAHILAQDQYGNYVTQRGKPHERSQIISKLTGRLVQMSQHKYASNVVEKCLEHGDVAERECLIEEILGQSDENNNLWTMMKDQFANYVVQKILETSNDKQQEVLLNRINVNIQALTKYTYGKHIVVHFEQLCGEEAEGSGV